MEKDKLRSKSTFPGMLAMASDINVPTNDDPKNVAAMAVTTGTTPAVWNRCGRPIMAGPEMLLLINAKLPKKSMVFSGFKRPLAAAYSFSFSWSFTLLSASGRVPPTEEDEASLLYTWTECSLLSAVRYVAPVAPLRVGVSGVPP